MTILAGFAFVPYVMELTGSIDMCENLSECVDGNYVPSDNTGLGYYYSDLSKDAELDLSNIQTQISLSIDTHLQQINSRIYNLYQINPIRGSEELRSMHELLNNDVKILEW